MDDQSLKNCLTILRAITEAPSSTTGMMFVEGLVTGQMPRKSVAYGSRIRPDQSVVAKTCSFLLDQFSQAKTVIENSQLSEEAKAGVRNGINSLSDTFTIQNLGQNMANIHANAAGYISNLVILLSAAGLDTDQNVPKSADELAADVDEMIATFSDLEIDPVVRDVARRHLAALSTLLRHINIFGVEPAMSAYFDLLTKIRRYDTKTSDVSKSALDKAFESIKSWGERLGVIDKAVNQGTRLLNSAEKASGLLEYLPDLSDVL